MGQKIPYNGGSKGGARVGMYPGFCYEDLNQKLKSFPTTSKMGHVASTLVYSYVSQTGVWGRSLQLPEAMGHGGLTTKHL